MPFFLRAENAVAHFQSLKDLYFRPDFYTSELDWFNKHSYLVVLGIKLIGEFILICWRVDRIEENLRSKISACCGNLSPRTGSEGMPMMLASPMC